MLVKFPVHRLAHVMLVLVRKLVWVGSSFKSFQEVAVDHVVSVAWAVQVVQLVFGTNRASDARDFLKDSRKHHRTHKTRLFYTAGKTKLPWARTLN